jgi:sialate O-acetylesterase
MLKKGINKAQRADEGAHSGKVCVQGLQLLVVTLLMGIGTAAADVKLPALISDNMVLQQGRQVAIWGTADAGEEVTVSLGEQSETATADSSGNWKVKLRPLKQGGPFEMTVAGKNTITIHNVLVGEVWVCSGQSNMEMPVGINPLGYSDPAENHEEEIAQGNYPMLRLFLIKHAAAGKPQRDLQGQWVVASPATVGSFSAVGYFFGRDLHQAMRFPVGMIQAAWGGTEAEAWTSDDTLEANPDLKAVADLWRQRVADFPHVLEQYQKNVQEWEKDAEAAEASGKVAVPFPDAPNWRKHFWDPRSESNRVAGLWNGMIAPLTAYAIAGVIWYQGESNDRFAFQYRKVFAIMIQQWRASWGEGDLPFLFVQLAAFGAKGKSANTWAVVRESQEKALALPKTGMATAVDIGDSVHAHPRNKQEVGRRLALAAENIAYGRNVEYMGPTFKSFRKDRGTLHLSFTHVAGGLVVRGPSLMGFQIAGEDQKFFPAQAQIAGEDQKFFPAQAQIAGNEVVVSSPQVPNPVAGRYAWEDDPKCNLYDKVDLPALPFRTDDWTVPTQGEVHKEVPNPPPGGTR